MSDFEAAARAEERSWALAELQDLIDEYQAPQCTDGVWRFPVSSEGEERNG